MVEGWDKDGFSIGDLLLFFYCSFRKVKEQRLNICKSVGVLGDERFISMCGEEVVFLPSRFRVCGAKFEVIIRALECNAVRNNDK